MNTQHKAQLSTITSVLIVSSLLIFGNSAIAKEASTADTSAEIPVTLENYKVAESDLAFGGTIKQGAVNKLVHLPAQPLDLNNQTVVRMNQDTIYSAAWFPLSPSHV